MFEFERHAKKKKEKIRKNNHLKIDLLYIHKTVQMQVKYVAK